MAAAPAMTVPTGNAIAPTANGKMSQGAGSSVEVRESSTVPAGRTYTQSGGTFKIYHDFKNSGTFNATAGTIEVAGTGAGNAFQSPGTNQFFNVRVDPSVSGLFDTHGASISVRGDWTNNGTASLTGSPPRSPSTAPARRRSAARPTTFRILDGEQVVGFRRPCRR